MTLSGIVPLRNGFSLDYCFRECIQSLLPVCEEVVVADGDSTDGTREVIDEWARREAKLTIVRYPWPNPKGDIDFFVKWIQFVRESAHHPFVFQLDADEVLSDHSYEWIEHIKRTYPEHAQVSFKCDRYNFWFDHRHMIPHGVCLSHRVIRLAPQNVWLPSDGPHVNGAACIGMSVDSPIQIFHYGFLRTREGFFRKAHDLQTMFFDSYDPRLAKAESVPGNWMEKIEGVEWTSRLLRFDGDHPSVAKEWLRTRGYE